MIVTPGDLSPEGLSAFAFRGDLYLAIANEVRATGATGANTTLYRVSRARGSSQAATVSFGRISAARLLSGGRASLELFDENHADVFRGRLPDAFGLLIVRIVVEPEGRFLRWEPDDRVHRPLRSFDDDYGIGI